MVILCRGALLLMFFNCCNAALAQGPVEYSIEYQASANGLAASAIRSLQRQPDQTYRLSNLLEASLGNQLIAKIEQVSAFASSDNKLQPISYSYQQTGLSQESQAINYNWNALVAISAEDEESWTIQLTPDTYDQLSHQLALREAIALGDDEAEFSVIDEDEIEIHRYQVLGKEVIATPLGNFNSTRVERVRATDDERNTTFWLADDWQFLLIRMEQSVSGMTVVLEISAGTLAGEEINP